MGGAIILLLIFSIAIFFMGIHISTSKDPFLPITYHGRRDKEYLNYLGKCVSLVSLWPFITALVAFSGDIIITGIVSIITLVICLVIAARMFKTVDKKEEKKDEK